jgi:Permuted papain-like amidase enzyme, YaeF/YiiX, C92 family
MSILCQILLHPFARLREHVRAALTDFLNRPATRHRREATRDAGSLSAILRNGDVLLAEGNTRAAALVKRLTRSTWSHVAMYVGPLDDGPNPRCIVEADVAAGVRSIRLSELEALNFRVLRPVALDDADRGRLAEWVISRIGGEYDLKHAWALARTFLPALLKSSLQPTPSGIAGNATRFICSTLLANAFAVVGSPIPPIRTPVSAVSAADHRYVIPSDFESAPIFEVVGQVP